jgi:hypothetical protein
MTCRSQGSGRCADQSSPLPRARVRCGGLVCLRHCRIERFCCPMRGASRSKCEGKADCFEGRPGAGAAIRACKAPLIGSGVPPREPNLVARDVTGNPKGAGSSRGGGFAFRKARLAAVFPGREKPGSRCYRVRDQMARPLTMAWRLFFRKAAVLSISATSSEMPIGVVS